MIGGGINGCGIARDAAGRGARVLLLEAGDLACGTSSASTKLIHGGLRYLEHREFSLVRESLHERELLWAIAPHIIRPLRFVLPHAPGLRPRWLLRLGLFIYDHIGGRKRLPPARSVDLTQHPAGKVLRADLTQGFEYSDCRVDDARLVILNARDAADKGATVLTRCPATGVSRDADGWRIETPQGILRARALVNAAGPQVLQVPGLDAGAFTIRLVRGSHIVVPRLFDHQFAYIFQLPDGRIFFAIPFEEDYTVIGTTDRDHAGGEPHASEEEIAYLCEGASRYFARPVRPADVVSTWSGVRALVDDGSGKPETATRGYRLDLSPAADGAPLLTVFGGKITTYRHLAEAAMRQLAQRLPLLAGPGWTDKAPLPGGDFGVNEAGLLVERLQASHTFLEPGWAQRLVRAHGTLAEHIFSDTRQLSDCGEHFGHGLTEREVRHMMTREWAMTSDDILRRRTRLGLRFTDRQAARLGDWMALHGGG